MNVRRSTEPNSHLFPSKIRDVNFTFTSPVLSPICPNWRSVLYCKPMNTETFSVRLDRSAKTRLQKLAKSTGRSLLAAEAISAYLDINEWQVAGITKALASLDRGKGIARAREADATARPRGIATLATPLSRGQRVDILLDAPGCRIDEAEQSLVCQGAPRSCQFVLAIPREMSARTCPITARLFVDSIPVGKLPFTLKIHAERPTDAADLVGEIAQRYRMAIRTKIASAFSPSRRSSTRSASAIFRT